MSDLILAIEGGGSRSQAVVVNAAGEVFGVEAGVDINVNFTSIRAARENVLRLVVNLIEKNGLRGEQVCLVATSIVGPRFGRATFRRIAPRANFRRYTERDVVFARAGIFQPHGVGLVSATGATAFAIRRDDGRAISVGGWGSLLGDEGSAYSAGLLGLRAAAKAFEGREVDETALVEAVCDHFGLARSNFKHNLIELAYRKPLRRAEIAGFATRVTSLAATGDRVASRIVAKVAGDLANLGLHAARRLFAAGETFDIVASGGFLNARDLVVPVLEGEFSRGFPNARFHLGAGDPALALARLAIFNLA